MAISGLTDRAVVTIDPGASVADAARTLRQHQISAVIVAEDQVPLGILTERDIVEAVVDGADPAATPVRDRMSTGLHTLPLSADDDDVSELMAKHGIRHVPIVDGGKIVALVSMRDRAAALAATAPRRPTTDFGTAGVVTHFRGPYHDGPPPKDLEVDVPSITKFGVAELRRMIVVYVVLVLAITGRLARKVFARSGQTWFEAASHGAVDGFERLGPTFVKLGQLVASSPGIFPAPLATACLRCLDDVPPFPGEQAVAMITADLGKPPAQVFKSFDEKPLSAASIGQVHACVLPDGREAVIKLQRPNIRTRMTTDLRILHRLARTAEKHLAFAKNANGVAIVEDLHAVTFSELNPAVEAYRQDRFRSSIWAFGDNRHITAPEVYWDFCGPHMICMERMAGVPMDQFETIHEMGVDGELVLRRGAKAWLEAVAVHGPFHGDMHAGNIWVLADGRATFLDFGIMGELPPEWKQVVKDLFHTVLVDQDWSRVARAYKRVGILSDDVGTDDEIGMRLGMLMGPMLATNVGDLNIGELINMSVQMAEQYGAQAPKELVLFGKQILYIERYVKGLAPNYAMLRDPFLIKNILPEEAAKRAAELGMTFPGLSMDEDAGLETGAPKAVAAGIPGVVASVRYARRQMGVRRSIATLRAVNQADGFDCPGCAWPEPTARSHAEFCENGAKAVAEEATRKRVGAEFFAAHTIDDLRGRTDHWLGQQGRLTVPVVRRAGADRYEPVKWDEAIALVADGLKALGAPDEACFYTSGRTSNEAAFLYQLLVRRFGTNNLPDCSNMCHESSGVALTETIGVGKGSVSLDDVESADLIIVVGQNPGTNHPRMLSSLERAKERGGGIIAINPLPEAGLLRFKNPQRLRGVLGRGTQLADLFLQIRVNGDLALFQLLNHLLVTRDDRDAAVLDDAFIAEHTDGFEAFAEHVRALDIDVALAACGLRGDEVTAALELVLAADSIVVCWAMGITQHRNAVATIREVVNFALLRGNIGRPGAGLCPVRGHSNVQGDRTMGIVEKPSPSFLDALGAEFGFEPPRHHGHDTVETIRAMRDGRVKAFVAMGGNFAAAAPDTEATYAALRNCDLTVQVSTKLNRSHVECGRTAVILPCLGRTERDARFDRLQVVTVEDSMSVVHRSEGHLEPAAPDLPSEVSIVCRLGAALLPAGGGIDWDGLERDHDRIRDHIEAVVPGFGRYNERVRGPDGFVLPHGPRDERSFPTATGRARFTVNPLEVLSVPDGCLLLQTIRSHDQFNTTIYGLDDRYRGISDGRRVVLAHPDDLAVLGRTDGEVVDVISQAADGVERRAVRFRLVGYPVARGTCAAYFPEANVLVPLDSVAEGSGTPTSKSIVVRFVRAGAGIMSADDPR